MGGAGQKSYLRTLLSDLRASLHRAGAGEILRKGFDSVAIVPRAAGLRQLSVSGGRSAGGQQLPALTICQPIAGRNFP